MSVLGCFLKMKTFRSFLFGFTFTASVLLDQTVSEAISSMTGDTFPHSFVNFDSVPEVVADGSVIRVRYRCSTPCQLTVEALVSTSRETDLVVFRTKWSSDTPGVNRIKRVLLRLPKSISDHQRIINGNRAGSQNVTLCGALDYVQKGSEVSPHRSPMLRMLQVQQVVAFSLCPVKPAECPSWSTQLMWQMTSNRIHQCPPESDVIDMVEFPLASTGEHFGVVRRFQPFISGILEGARLHAATQPSVAFSAWIYLLKWCHGKLCGIIHHVDERSAFDSLLMQLTETGDIIIQARVTTGEDEAFRASVMLPLWKWIRLDCYILDSKVVLDVTWDSKAHRFQYQFKNSIHYNDTNGYFVIGGGRYMPGISGYFGPVKYYRLGTKQINNPLQPNATSLELDRLHMECQEMRNFTKAFLQDLTQRQTESKKGVCFNDFRRLFENEEKTCTQKWTFETQLKYSELFKFLLKEEGTIRKENVSMKCLGSTLFHLTITSAFAVGEEPMQIPFKSMALLQASSCFGHHRATLLLATIYLSGLGHPVNKEQGHVYSLIGAASDDRFALMHAGYKHKHGADGFPKDLDMAYSYYSNAGAQSSTDVSQNHEDKQYLPHHIYLGSEEDLNSLTHELSDIFQYLKFEAERGDPESQRRLGMMLYWGQNGLSKDIASALKWFQRSAMQMKDAAAMYDYSILLMKGHGVRRNYTHAFQLLKKAAAMGSINALNGLGWYHGTVLKDHKNAMKYFEQAALNGSDDGMYNLGVYYLTGKNPAKPLKNESAAFEQFLKAARLGHIAAAVEAAWYLSTGSLEGVSRNVVGAVILLQNVCEQNGHLGFLIRDALQAYLRGSWQEALVKYILAAETGSGLAQSNVAHLCEELKLGYDCQWRYFNYSILNSDPHPSTLLKMGDHFYYHPSSTHEDSLSMAERAVSMYGRAALAGSPQGMYNLAIMAQNGHTLPTSIMDFFNASQNDRPNTVMEKILKRCAEAENEEAVTPCTLALLGLQMGKAWRSMTQNHGQLLLTYASVLSVFIFVAFVPLQNYLESRRRAPASRRRTSSAMQRQPTSIMGEPTESSWLSVNAEWRLHQASDLAVTLSGVCLCFFLSTLLFHLL